MAELIDISNEKFWDILFDEACVEGQQAKRIETELKQIATTEAEIRAKTIEEFAEQLKELKAIKNWKADIMEEFCRYDASSIDEIVHNARSKAIDETVKCLKNWLYENTGLSLLDIQEIDEIAEQLKGE